jgi:hypothetical protein
MRRMEEVLVMSLRCGARFWGAVVLLLLACNEDNPRFDGPATAEGSGAGSGTHDADDGGGGDGTDDGGGTGGTGGGTGGGDDGGTTGGDDGGTTGGDDGGTATGGGPCEGNSNPPGGASCPAVCSHCEAGQNTCVFDCAGSSSCYGDDLSCPPGWACRVICAGPEACDTATVTCPPSYPCEVECNQLQACEELEVYCDSGRCSAKCIAGDSVCLDMVMHFGTADSTVSCGAGVGGPTVEPDPQSNCACEGC